MLLVLDELVVMFGLAPLNHALSPRCLGLYSTFIIKQNVQYFPMKILHAVLVSRHGYVLLDIGLSCSQMLVGLRCMSWHMHGVQRELHAWFIVWEDCET